MKSMSYWFSSQLASCLLYFVSLSIIGLCGMNFLFEAYHIGQYMKMLYAGHYICGSSTSAANKMFGSF